MKSDTSMTYQFLEKNTDYNNLCLTVQSFTNLKFFMLTDLVHNSMTWYITISLNTWQYDLVYDTVTGT